VPHTHCCTLAGTQCLALRWQQLLGSWSLSLDCSAHHSKLLYPTLNSLWPTLPRPCVSRSPRYAQDYQLSTMRQVAACSGRAFKLHIRDKDNFVIPFTNQSIIQGLVIGSIFWYVRLLLSTTAALTADSALNTHSHGACLLVRVAQQAAEQ
jgi:hypothetical protein